MQDVTCDTVPGSIKIKYSALRSNVYFSIDSGVTYSSSNIFNGLQAGTYEIMVTDSQAWVYGGSASISVIPVTKVDLGPDTTICEDESITLDAGSGFLTYSWSNGLTQQSITIDGSNIGTGTHKYTVTVTDSNVCKSTDSIFVEVKDYSAIEESSLVMNILPNPASETIRINTKTPVSRFSLFDISGKHIRSRAIKRKRRFDINISSLPSGTYILRIKNPEGQNGQRRFIKK